MPQTILGGLLLPYLETKILKNQKTHRKRFQGIQSLKIHVCGIYFSLVLLLGKFIRFRYASDYMCLNKSQIKLSSHISRDFIELTNISYVSKSPHQLNYHSLCGISHNGLPRVTACMSMQGIHCVFATH